MSTPAFSHFLDLPAEIQGRIWHLVAFSLPSRSEQAKLLLISRSSSIWIQDILYHTVYGHSFRFRRLSSSILANDEVFRIKTKRLLLWDIDRRKMPDMAFVIPTFQALQSAYIEPHDRPFEVLANLLALPNLTELHMSNQYAKITSEELASFEGSPSRKTITRVCYRHGEIDPPSALFGYFPTLLYLIIRGDRPPNRGELQRWLTSSRQSLRAFTLMDIWRQMDKAELTAINILAKQCGKKFGVIQVTLRFISLSSYWKIMDRVWNEMRRIEEGVPLVDMNV
ncbi:hypothetical protein DL96DRAFT_1609613 [Flagelloscypha sp. PMI_526]|nr:hypothetical protein DL96DRAFT_1609613 [Flagelloscypha sp. PMI_526]